MRRAWTTIANAIPASLVTIFWVGLVAGFVSLPVQGSEADLMQRIDRQVADWEAGRVYFDAPETDFQAVGEPLADGPFVAPMVGNEYVCLPTCSEVGGRFLSIASQNLNTLAGDQILLRMFVPAGETSFEIGVYDGDSGGTWDQPGGTSTGVPLEYTVLADPTGDGSGTFVVGQWLGNIMPDVAWFSAVLPTGPEAATPSGNFLYLVRVRSTNFAASGNWSNFKFRTTGTISTSVSVSPIAFGFSTPLFSGAEGIILYPAGPGSPGTTTYDGNWTFFLDAFQSLQDLVIWDGDFDRGTVGAVQGPGSTLDTDDPNTPGAPFLPPWAIGTVAVPEGVATVPNCTTEQSATGCPADDRTSVLFLRTPSINYSVTTPTGLTFNNANPSGNLEWEQFLVSTLPPDPSANDYSTPALPPGLYRVDAAGIDLSNLNAWRFFNPIIGVCQDGTPCKPLLRPYLVGDTVFLDSNSNGSQDPGEPGIGSVVVNLIDSVGALIATTTTDATGFYEFGAEAATLTVEVAAENFDPGGALEGLTSTTGDSITDTVVDDNVLTYDFGYVGSSSIGNYVWLDVNGDGINNEPATAAIGGVTVNLTEAGPDGTFGTPDDISYPAQVTDSAGFYDFTQLPPGTYRVDVDESTLPPSFLALTTGNEPLTYTLGANEDYDDADFGYQGPNGLGDLVWRDNNGDGLRQLGEPGIGGVSVSVFDDAGNLLGTTTTNGFGVYQFNGLPDGTYRVEVDPATLPAGFAPTFDRDGIGTPHVAGNIELQANDEFGQFDSTVDFGYQPASGAIGDTVWRDDNGNGVQDVGEPGISGVTVTLRDSGGTVVGTDVTDGNGNYGFTGLGADTYTVTVDPATLPAGLAPTYDLDGVGTPNTTAVTLGAGETNNNVDFGYRGTGAIGDRVWRDDNGDGVQDAGEPGISGVTVTLRDSGGNVVGTDVTDGNGNYGFTNLSADTYTVDVDGATLPAGLAPTFDLDGIGTPNTASVTLGAGETNNDVDFGYQGTGAIGDRVWRDDNGDGVQDAGEPGISGVTVTLRDSGGNVVGTAVTDGNGNYAFSNLPADTYTVDVDAATLPAGLAPTFDFDGIGTPNTASVPLGAGETNNDVDFGYQGTGAIGDRIWNDVNGDGVQDAGEPGISGVTVTLRDSGGNVVGTAVTDGNGNYSFPNLPADTYAVDVDPATLPAGITTPTFDFDGTGTPNTASVTLGAGETNNDVDFGYQGDGAIGDRVWRDDNGDGVQDAGEPGISGVTVTLRDSGGNVVGTDVTDANGTYGFSGLGPDTYTVDVDPATLPAGLAPTFDFDGTGTPNTASVPLAAGATNNDVDFGYQGTGAIGDRVWQDDNGNGVQDAGEPGISGVTVTLRDSGGNVVGTDVTDANGTYGFSGLGPDTYTVDVDPATLPAGLAPTFDFDGTGTPNTASVPLAAGATNNDVDFGYQGTGAIGDRVWQDDNGNGVQDAGEPGISGVTVTLRDSGGNVVGTDVTDANGTYGFSGLGPDTYTVDVDPATLPAGYTPTFDFDGIGTPNTASVALGAGETNNAVDFGYEPPPAPANIGDRVWLDLNADGVQDAGEPGIDGVTVELLDAGGNVLTSQVTAGDGNYLFGNLAAGTYTVRVDTTTLPTGLAQTFDADGLGTPHQSTVTVAAGESNLDQDFGYTDETNCVEVLNGATDLLGLYSVITVENLSTSSDIDGLTFVGGSLVSSTSATFAQNIGSLPPSSVTLTVVGDIVAGNPLNIQTGSVAVGGSTNGRILNFNGGGSLISDPGLSAAQIASDLLNGSDQLALATANNTVTIPSGQPGPLNFNVTAVDGTGLAVFNVAGNAIFDNNFVQQIEVNPGSATTVLINVSGTSINWTNGNKVGSYLTSTLGRSRVIWNFYEATSINLNARNFMGALLAPRADVTAQANIDGSIAARSLTTTSEVHQPVFEGNLTGVCDPQSAAVGDRVWQDDNGNGVQDAGEPGISGVTVTLRDSGGNVVGTDVTDGNGTYGFTGLPAGSYTVEIDPATLPAGVTPTYDFDGTVTANNAAVTLGPGETNNDVDFGYEPPPAPASIGDRIWKDLNSDGVQDAGELGINGVTVELLDAGGNLIASQVTAGDGGYTFGNLAAGTYTVRVDASTLPAGYTQTFDADGLGTPNASTVTVAAGEANVSQDFGYNQGDDMPYCPSPADADAFGSNGGHAFWLPGISTELVFVGTSGSFVELSDGTATLTGTLVDANDSSKRFEASVTFTGRTTTPPAGSPKKELAAGAYVENGGPVDPSTWRYYTSYTGTLTGEGSWDGAQLTYTRTGPAFQVGVGASGKNVNFGASSWFNWTVISQPTSGGSLPSTGQGDINIDLTEGPCADECVTVNFDNLATGTIVDSEFAALGMTVTTNSPGAHPAMIFNTASPTGGDTDLGTPNQGFGGPGVGSGGAPGQQGQNSVALGKVLIISEDGDSNDPDDNAGGGTVIFTFAQPVFIDQVNILDIDEGSAGAVKLYNASGGLISQVPMADLGDNSVQTLAINQTAVSQMKVWFPGSGAISGFSFCPGEPEGGEPCNPGYVKDKFDHVSYNNNDGSVNWTGDWIENDAAGAGPGSGNVTINNGFLFLEDHPDTGTEPSLARQVDLSGVGTATLRFAFDTSSQVDASDAIAVEVSDDGGATWTILETITGITGEVNQSRTFDITAFASGQTQVRFRVANLYGGDGEFFCVQWVEVSWTCPVNPDALGSVGGTVWNDANGNGIQEDPSTGISGVTVKLKQNGTVLETTTTDGNGYYSFTDLAAGTYEVKVTTSSLPAGVTVPTYDLDGTGTASRTNVTLGGGQHRDDADFGYQAESTSPCSYCEHHGGYLNESGAYKWQPDGNYYWSEAGSHEAWLTGDGADFDLYLYRWNGNNWSVVASSTADGTSNEHVSHSGSSGHYVWLVRSYSGSGDFDFYLDRP